MVEKNHIEYYYSIEFLAELKLGSVHFIVFVFIVKPYSFFFNSFKLYSFFYYSFSAYKAVRYVVLKKKNSSTECVRFLAADAAPIPDPLQPLPPLPPLVPLDPLPLMLHCGGGGGCGRARSRLLIGVRLSITFWLGVYF